MTDPNSDLTEIRHVKGDSFTSTYATGALVTGPIYPDEGFTITFFADVVDVIAEGMTRVSHESNRTSYKVAPRPADHVPVREDVARVRLSRDVLESIAKVIAEKLAKKD